MQMQPPKGIADDLVADARHLRRSALRPRARPGRCQHIEPFGSAYLVDTEQMGVVADDHQPVQTIGAGNHGDAAGRLFGIAALGFRDDGGLLRNAHAHQVSATHGAFGVGSRRRLRPA